MRRVALIASIAAAALAAAPAAHATTVTAMVVGKSSVLSAAKPVKLQQRRVKAGSRRCTVAGATPLAALAGLHLTFRLRDYQHCGRRVADAAGLFVTRIGSERNRGTDGWVYKVGRKTASVGAADPSGRRLRAGDRLLWFWCRTQQSGGCQRTLEATPERSTAGPGESLRVTVRGYDDAGRGVAIPGATVTLGGASAVTGSDGVATVTVPSSGRLRLTATAPGLVTAFPREVRAG
ncbi:MAG: hypothetical protein QOE28_2311 [Solirubrobacteraceae bacterium]|jgi:hypothetical protein|nr:hypothetical protein [Solirubrobacteraceae bacterium]